MRIVENKTKRARVVEYFGATLYVSHRCNWVATDSTGAVYGYEGEPHLRGSNVWLDFNNDVYEELGTADLQDTDWKTTLVKV